MPDLGLERLLSIERRGWDSLCRSEGGTFYGRLMTPDALMVLPNGVVMDRDTIAGSLDGAPPWTSYELEDARVVPVSDRSAALVYTATATREGDAAPFTALMASVYCLLGEEIRLALYQQTTITH
ncbi:nuclear transport factor 2 family protein [Paenibacillus sp. TRM 82003]|uniref:nuclear transport factor 2 family protein n=1 Tax=Kineococcus sp. TRM81007 TaxID=2925831 RepID=UPI001F564442|nr:nuclear transport factor 2 family protein [Kineococcus sp. TRM81007]MCI2237990.1 nuclear transport factor 2 family protein [Kineococcus sp. TRM81007]MCI3926005.1 nuclear transport factor 2 family protein [Paenibacillus sp. TRM 82003]